MPVADAPLRGGARKRRPPKSTPVSRARAQGRSYGSQGAAVAKQAYKTESVPQRRADVHAAHGEQRHHLAAAKRVYANELGRSGSDKAALTKATRVYETLRRSSGTSPLLEVHGQRHSERSQLIRKLRPQIVQAGYTPGVSKTNVMPAAWKNEIGFKDFKGYTKRAQKGKLGIGELALAKKITSTSSGAHDPLGIIASRAAKGTKSTALFALNQIQRTSSALGAAQLERSNKGGGGMSLGAIGQRASAAWEGFKHPEKHGGDWIEAARKQKWPVPVVSGTIASIATDPLTYLSLGAASPAKAAALKVYEESVAKGLAKHEAVALARKTFEDMPAHTKVMAPRIGVRGMPARVARLSTGQGFRGAPIMSKPVGGRVIAGAKTGVGKLNVKHVPILNKAPVSIPRRIGSALSPRVTPHGWNSLDYTLARRGAAIARSAGRHSEAHGLHRLEAYRKLTKDWDAAKHERVALAIDKGGHALNRLAPDERKVADHYAQEVHVMGSKEAQRGVLDADINSPNAIGLGLKPAAPHIPERVTAEHVKGTRNEVQAAMRALASAGRGHAMPAELRGDLAKARVEVSRAHKAAGEAKGRRGMQELHTGPNAVPSLGQEAANARLSAAQENLKRLSAAARGHGQTQVAEARARVQAATAAHKLTRNEALLQRKALTQYEREAAQWHQANEMGAHGYFHRTPLDLEGKPRISGPRPAASTISNPHRSMRDALENVDDVASKYDLRIPESIARRTQQHWNKLGAQDLNETIASLGREIHPDQALKHPGAVFSADATGVRPLFRSSGEVDMKKVAATAAHPHQRLIALDPDQADAIRYMAQGQRAKPGRTNLHLLGDGEKDVNLLQNVTRKARWWYTLPNPAYHLRNEVTDIYNMRQADTSVGDMYAGARLRGVQHALYRIEKSMPGTEDSRILRNARTHVEDYGGRKLSDVEMLELMDHHGVLRAGHAGGELHRRVNPADIGKTKTKGIAKLAEKLASGSEFREEMGRAATFRGAMKRGMSPAEAADWTAKHLVDYSEVSHVERHWLRNFALFYTWTARNVPLQAEKLVTRPGVAATAEKVRRATGAAWGGPNAQDLPGYQQDSPPWTTPLKLTVPDGKGGKMKVPLTFNPQLSTSALSFLPNPASLKHHEFGREAKDVGQKYLSLLHPGLKYPLEAATGKSLFTGADIPQGKEVPLNPGVASVLKTLAPGSVHMIHDPRTGKMVPGVDWKTYSALQAVGGPLGNPLLRAGTVGKTELPENAKLRAAGLVIPQPRAMDPRSTRISALYEESDRLREAHQHAVQRYPGKHKPGDPWPKKSMVAKINRRQSEIVDEITALTARIQGVSVPKKKGKAGPAHGSLQGIGGGGALAGGGRLGGLK